eukprot:m.240989 g.240989  ORF g.240989 m.240989 type:complete len:110 (+) comp13762_c0_seq1:18-347(+)
MAATAATDVYRQGAMGQALKDTLDELCQSQQITPELAAAVLRQFDRSMASVMESQLKNKISFRNGDCKTYKLNDNVWDIRLAQVEVTNESDRFTLDKLHIVAADAKCFS